MVSPKSRSIARSASAPATRVTPDRCGRASRAPACPDGTLLRGDRGYEAADVQQAGAASVYAEALRLLEAYGVETPDGHVQAPPGLLTKATGNRYLQRWGYDWATLRRPPPAVRFQARYSNACWHFDLSPSDLKHVKTPAWVQEGVAILPLDAV